MREERKVVTALFADVVGSTERGSRSRSLKVASSARSPDHTRWFRRSATTSNTTSGRAADVTDTWLRNVITSAYEERTIDPDTFCALELRLLNVGFTG